MAKRRHSIPPDAWWWRILVSVMISTKDVGWGGGGRIPMAPMVMDDDVGMCDASMRRMSLMWRTRKKKKKRMVHLCGSYSYRDS